MLVEFLRGKQDELPTSGASNGAFYLTEDTKRLYICLEDNGVPQLLNQTVQIVTSLANLPDPDKGANIAINDFYYCSAENILAVYTGKDAGGWIQINPDTGAIGVEIVGSGNAITSVSYDASTRKLTFTKGETFATADELDNFKTYVGTYPADKDEEGNPKYINAIDYVIQVATGGSSESAASVKQQLDTYKATNDAAVAEAQSTANTAKENVATINIRLGDIEDTINSINPMSYKGIVNSEKPLSSLTNVSVGDTYMVAEAGLYEGESAKVGDLFIATLGNGATEENNIINGTIEWTYIPSGDETDTDTQYSLKVDKETGKIYLYNETAETTSGKEIEVTVQGGIAFSETVPNTAILTTLAMVDGYVTGTLNHHITSDNLKLTSVDNNTMKINLEWGTF